MGRRESRADQVGNPRIIPHLKYSFPDAAGVLTAMAIEEIPQKRREQDLVFVWLSKKVVRSSIFLARPSCFHHRSLAYSVHQMAGECFTVRFNRPDVGTGKGRRQDVRICFAVNVCRLLVRETIADDKFLCPKASGTEHPARVSQRTKAGSGPKGPERNPAETKPPLRMSQSVSNAKSDVVLFDICNGLRPPCRSRRAPCVGNAEAMIGANTGGQRRPSPGGRSRRS